MVNHYHLLEPGEANLSLAALWLNLSDGVWSIGGMGAWGV